MRIRLIYCCVACILFFSFSLSAQKLEGKVTDAVTGESLPGASVMIQGTQTGAMTDANGNFSFPNAPETGILLIRYIGYDTKEVEWKDRTPLVIQLREDTKLLDEVVVIGYGVQKKSDLTGSVSSVNADELRSVAATHVAQALQGKAAGVEVVQNSGAPGASTSVRIRGMGTVNNSDPLYVVDGIPMDDINYISSDDIASIEILKDAASAAIYGSRAANGVVLVTTKNGQNAKKKFNLNFNTSVGWQTIVKQPNIMSTEDYVFFNDFANNASVYTELRGDGTLGIKDIQQEGIANGNDWWDLSTRSGMMYKTGLSIFGGDNNLNYYLSANHLKSEGIVKESEYARKSFNAKINAKPAKNVTIGTNITYSREDQTRVSEGTNSVIKSAILYNPLKEIIRVDGTYTWLSPVENLRRLTYDRYTNNFIGQVNMDWNIVKELTFSSRAGYINKSSDVDRFQRHNTSEMVLGSNRYTVIKNPTANSNISWDNILTYSTVFKNDHDFSIMAGQTMETYRTDYLYSSGTGYGGYDPEFNSLGFAAFDQSTNSYSNGWATLSFLGRITYSYKNKYLFQSNFRADGSSRFSKKNRWGYFPSVSLGWKINEESFLSDVREISLLKIRAGWGQLGNSSIPNLSKYTLVTYENENYIYGVGNPSLIPGMSISQYGNPDIKWERTESTTIGIDFNMLNNRLTSSFDYFIKDTKDMLIEVPIVYSAGYANIPYQNAGSIRNQGVELQLGWKGGIKDFRYELSGNISHINNKVTSLGKYGESILGGNLSSPNNLGYVTRTMIDLPIAVYYGYKTQGLLKEEDFDGNGNCLVPVMPSAQKYNPGDMKFMDINGDGIIDDNDKTVIGNPHPKFFYGFNVNLAYKNFDLSMFFQGAYGNEVFNVMNYFYYSHVAYNGSWSSNDDYSNVARDYFDRVYRPAVGTGTYRDNWGANTNGDVPLPSSLGSRNTDNFSASDFYIEDGSYLRLKNIQLSYNLPKPAAKKIAAAGVRLYASATNLFTLTKYSGLDPEIGKVIGTESNNLSIGLDQGTYPQSRTWMFGVVIDF